MAWNEPGKNDNGSQSEGPPDLDKFFKDLFKKFSGKKEGGSNSNESSPNRAKTNLSPTSLKPFAFLGLGIIAIIWILSGIYIVSPPERSVVLLLGSYDKTEGPGPHWIAQGIQSQRTVNIDSVSTYSYEAEMLTKDQNIVDVSLAVQYKIVDIRAYLYNVNNPNISLQEATASALRQVIGNTTLDQVLTTGRADVRDAVVTQLTNILANYNTGIQVIDVSLQPAQAPAEVKASFDDAIKAQEDEQRYKNQAEAYANGVVPIAQGQAQRIAQEANAYQQQIVLQAQGDVAQFDAIYSAYRNAPAVTRERIYLTTMEDVLNHASKIYVDAKNNNVIYLPLDKWVSHQKPTAAISSAEQATANAASATTADNVGSTSNLNTLPSVSRPENNPDSLVGVRGDRP